MPPRSDITSSVEFRCIQKGSFRVAAFQAGCHCTICRVDLDSSEVVVSKHLESWVHKQHVVWIERGIDLPFAYRNTLIDNRFIIGDYGWFDCTLCNKRAKDYDASLPHIQSIKHQARLLDVQTMDDNVDGISENVREPCTSPLSITEHLQGCSIPLEELVNFLTVAENNYVNAQELQDISIGLCKLSSLFENLNEKIRSLKEVVATSQSRCDNGRTYLLCFKRDRSKLLLPCKHFALCNECLGCLAPKLCPICREEIVESHDVIVS